jgi:triacylglycerol lipase
MADVPFLINVIYPAASSAYTIMNVPTPPLALPTGYALVGPINANPQRAAAAMLVATPGQQHIANTMLAESSIFGLVAWNATEQTAMVAIRGTKTIWEWIEDLDAAPVPYLPCPAAGLVHMGFQLVYEHIRDSIAALLKAECAAAKRILVTGHSLGAAVAVLCGFDIAKNLKIGPVPELNTFAGPRAGAPDFAASFNALIPGCTRVVNFMDVVPQVPLPPVYEHVGAELLVHGGFKPLDVTYAHHLTTYLNGLQKLPTP